MKWLLWREFRLNGVVLIAGAVLFLLPYLFTTVAVLWPREVEVSRENLFIAFGRAAYASCWLSLLTITILGGNAFAGEIADRSAEFMAYLPVSHQRRLVSKLILVAVVTALIWSINLLVLWGFMHSLGPPAVLVFGEAVGHVVSAGLVMFGVAWYISSLQSSPTFAVCGGIAAPIVILMGILMGNWAFGIEDQRILIIGFSIIATTLGVIGFSIGTCYYLKRVEP